MNSSTLEPKDPMELVRELRATLGMFTGAMPISPAQAWQSALAVVADLVADLRAQAEILTPEQATYVVESDPAWSIERMLRRMDAQDKAAFNFCCRQIRPETPPWWKCPPGVVTE